jgi:hypothetical protein
MPEAAAAPEVNKSRKKIAIPKRKSNVPCWIVVFPPMVLITQIEQIESNGDEPNCKLIEPYLITDVNTCSMEPYLLEYCTNGHEFFIHSDKIWTLMTPSQDLQEEYQKMVGG